MTTYISTIAKNEFQYIREFVTHHIGLGFDRIIIYDNNASDGEHYDKLLASEIATGKAEIIDVRGKSNYQNKSYQESYARHRDEEGWMFFIDVDEFLILEHETDVHRFLEHDCFSTFN